METMALGAFAVILFILSVCCLCYKKPVLGIASSIVTVILTFLTGNGWRELLISGGKDTALLGFQR